jgi:hypothetical protein
MRQSGSGLIACAMAVHESITLAGLFVYAQLRCGMHKQEARLRVFNRHVSPV